MQFRGHRPRTILYGRPTFSVHQRRAGVEARPYGGVGADGRRDRLHPRFLRCASLCPQPNVCNFAGAARAPFCTGVRRFPFTNVGRAWKPAPTVGGEVSACNRRCPSSGGGASGTPPLTGGLYSLRCGIKRRGAAHAPFLTGVRSYPTTNAGRAWKPSPAAFVFWLASRGGMW